MVSKGLGRPLNADALEQGNGEINQESLTVT